jgi:hypothetical protein
MGEDTMLNCFAYFDGGATLAIYAGARVGAHANFTTVVTQRRYQRAD